MLKIKTCKELCVKEVEIENTYFLKFKNIKSDIKFNNIN